MREHEKIPYDSFAQQAYWGEGMRLPGQSKGLDRWFFQWQWRNTMRAEDEIDSDEPVITESGYYASYVIGAQWFDEEKTMPLVVTTKYGCDRIDFLKMFSVCFNSGIEAKEFSKIYAVDMEQPRIKAPRAKERAQSPHCRPFPLHREGNRQARTEKRLCPTRGQPQKGQRPYCHLPQ